MHTLVGAGSAGRGLSAGAGLDVANLLKPPLARGELQCIGATTLGEFRKYFERDAALERRFQPVHVGEASAEQALAILGALQGRYERHHGCAYAPAALQAAVSLSSRYVADRFLPDKARRPWPWAGVRAGAGAPVCGTTASAVCGAGLPALAYPGRRLRLADRLCCRRPRAASPLKHIEEQGVSAAAGGRPST